MTEIAILNIVLVVVVVAGMLAFLGRSIVADRAPVAQRAGRERKPAQTGIARAGRGQRGTVRSFG
jgi:hypothetical protein